MEVYNLGRVICKPSATPNWGEPKENDQATRTTLGHALF